jgi:hypothetical protein
MRVASEGECAFPRVRPHRAGVAGWRCLGAYDDPRWPSSRRTLSTLPWKVDSRTGIGVARLFEAPVAWSRQHHVLGLTL